MSPTVGSLFTGIGGIDLGLQRAGFEITWQVEIDEYCCRVLAKHWPHVTRYRDVRDVGAGNLAPVDLIAGGFPCQDVSNAGKRAGIEGEQSGLWSEFARVVGELRPEYVLVENVTALLGRGFSRVLGDLAALGYDAEWECIPAAALGAPHIRDRVFLLAYAQCGERERGRVFGDVGGATGTGEGQTPERERLRDAAGDSGAVLAEAGSLGCGELHATSVLRGRESETEQAGLGSGIWSMAHANGEPKIRASESWSKRNPWTVEPDVGRVAPRVSTTVDRLRGLGNAVVPQVAEYIGHQLMQHLGAEAAS